MTPSESMSFDAFPWRISVEAVIVYITIFACINFTIFAVLLTGVIFTVGAISTCSCRAFIGNAVVVIVRVASIYRAIAVLIVLARVILAVLITVRSASGIDVAFVYVVIIGITRIDQTVSVGVRLA